MDASKNLTLGDVAKEINFDPSRLNVDSIDVTADNTIFNRFDHFNAKYVVYELEHITCITDNISNTGTTLAETHNFESCI